MFTYWDASILSALLFQEPGSETVARALMPLGARNVVSDFASAEASSAVSRRFRMGLDDREAANTRLAALDAFKADVVTPASISPGDVELAEALVRAFELKLRAPDALHAATCLNAGYQLATLDLGLAKAAETLGIPIFEIVASSTT